MNHSMSALLYACLSFHYNLYEKNSIISCMNLLILVVGFFMCAGVLFVLHARILARFSLSDMSS